MGVIRGEGAAKTGLFWMRLGKEGEGVLLLESLAEIEEERMILGEGEEEEEEEEDALP